MKNHLKKLSLALLLAGLGASALATNYSFVMPKPTGMSTASPITVALTTYTLPVGTLNAAYNGTGFDFKPSLVVTGDAGFNSSLASFSLTAGTLPTGVTLSPTGVLAGTPSVTTAGASFTVAATYKTKTGQQVYTIIVNGVSLQVTSIAGGSMHTCAVTTAGGAKCWGYNGQGQLGDGTTVQKTTPVDVSGLTSGVASITTEDSHTCAVTTAGGAKCWGYNGHGQLGDGTTVNKSTPVAVSGLASGVASLAVGTYHTCAVTTSGGAKCWGYNAYGQLGDGTTVSKSTPVAVSGLASGVASLSAGIYHTCAITTAGGVKCWGNNVFGQLGDGTTVDKSTPVAVLGLASGVASISAGTYHTCAITTAGGAKCWGYNSNGQLGDGTTVSKSTPVAVSGLASGVASLSAGIYHTCAITTAGGVKCWGYNSEGDLGDGTTVDKATPVAVSGLASGVASISAGGYHTCAITTAGAAKCWGYNGNGELGDGTTVSKSTPVAVLP